MTQPDDRKQADPQNLQATRGALGTGGAGPVERSPAETVRDVVQGDQGGTPQTPGAAGVSSGLQSGGTTPASGAGGRRDLRGNFRVPGGSGGENA